MSLANLPDVNACLNVASAALLASGFVLIRARRREAHACSMAAAFVASVLFLVSYTIYHYHHPTTKYPGRGCIRMVYFAVLSSHVVLALAVPPLALRTLYLALRRRWEAHRRWASWTFPIWLYVSATGVAVYLMLYVFTP